jgi:hypothetical protein
VKYLIEECGAFIFYDDIEDLIAHQRYMYPPVGYDSDSWDPEDEWRMMTIREINQRFDELQEYLGI